MSLKTTRKNFENQTLTKHDYIHKMHEVHKYLFEYCEVMQNTDVTNIEITPEGVFFTVKHRALNIDGPGLKFLLDSRDERIAPIEILNFDTYELDDFSMITKLVKPNHCVLDIGGNIGFYSVCLGKKFPTTQFHAFEPIPRTFSYLKKHIEINKLENVKAYNFGFSDEEKDLTFFFYPQGSGNASAANLSSRADVEKVVCHVKTVDQFVTANKLKIDFIKCDVEGAELFVFRGAKNTIASQRPVVFAEILRKWSKQFNYDPNEIFGFFKELNYKAYVTKGTELVPFSKMSDETLETNFFFVP